MCNPWLIAHIDLIGSSMQADTKKNSCSKGIKSISWLAISVSHPLVQLGGKHILQCKYTFGGRHLKEPYPKVLCSALADSFTLPTRYKGNHLFPSILWNRATTSLNSWPDKNAEHRNWDKGLLSKDIFSTTFINAH